jgi:outer membrane immunogenic protein
MMKNILLGAVGLAAAGIAAPAVAADLPAVPTRSYTKAPAYVASIYDWSGFYLGANAGYGTERSCWDFTNAGAFVAAEGCHNAGGAIAGGQLGYRLQSGSFVYGLEAQGDWANLSGSNPSIFTPGLTNRSRMDAFGLFTGQFGYALNNTLLYVKGGAAVTDNKYDQLVTSSGAPISSAGELTRWGGTAGVGVEYGFTPNWSAAIEYDHLFISSGLANFTVTQTALPFGTDRVRGDTDLVSARINYKWGSPGIAKY